MSFHGLYDILKTEQSGGHVGAKGAPRTQHCETAGAPPRPFSQCPMPPLHHLWSLARCKAPIKSSVWNTRHFVTPQESAACLDAELSAPPVPALGVVPARGGKRQPDESLPKNHLIEGHRFPVCEGSSCPSSRSPLLAERDAQHLLHASRRCP